MRVRDYMASKVFALQVDKKLIVAQEIMDWAHVRHVPVIDREKRVVGIISHRDLLHASISSVAPEVANVERKQHLRTIPIDKVMREGVQTIGPDATVQEAAKAMRTNKIGCLPVVERGKLVGIISEYDLLHIVERL